MDRYCALVKVYSDGVNEMRDAHGTVLDERRQHADVLRIVAQEARADWEDHERTHGCVRKPPSKIESIASRGKTDS